MHWDEHIGRIKNVLKSAACHFINRKFLGRSKSIFDSAQNSKGVFCVTLKLKYHINNVFQHFGTRNGSVFCNMSDYDYRCVGLLCKTQQSGGALSDLRNASCRRFYNIRINGLNRIYYKQLRSNNFGLLKNILQRSLRKHHAILVSTAESFRS